MPREGYLFNESFRMAGPGGLPLPQPELVAQLLTGGHPLRLQSLSTVAWSREEREAFLFFPNRDGQNGGAFHLSHGLIVKILWNMN